MENVAFEAWQAVYGVDAEFIADVRGDLGSPAFDVARLPAPLPELDPVREAAEFYAGRDGLSHLDLAIREVVCSLLSWAVPSPGALRAVADWAGSAGVFEVGAGTGYWAALLSDLGVDVIAADAAPSGGGGNRWHAAGVSWFDVTPEPASAAFMHSDRTLLVSWPPRTGAGAFGVDGYREAGGRQVVFVGEWARGCVDAALWAEVTDYWRVADRAVVPQWRGIHDEMLLLTPR